MPQHYSDEISEVYQNDEEHIIDILKNIYPDIADKDFLTKKIENDKRIFSLFFDGDVDAFLSEFIGKIEEDSSFFEDAYEYVYETKVELLRLNDLMEEENKLMLKDPFAYFEENNRVPKLYNESTKILNEISNRYEESKEENRKFRIKAMNTIFSLVKIGVYNDEMLLDNIVSEKKHFEDVSKFVESYITMFIETTTELPPDDEDYGKSVKRILKEDHRILNNLKSIKKEMNELKKEYIVE